ncbi:hypothetical protein ACROYT_G019646 [Oculina patagonica]
MFQHHVATKTNISGSYSFVFVLKQQSEGEGYGVFKIGAKIRGKRRYNDVFGTNFAKRVANSVRIVVDSQCVSDSGFAERILNTPATVLTATQRLINTFVY